jgi:2-polyprenyl-3-methyl-5-hydroxy-6-metoxy-1,4-benzoquinol methylase
MTETAAMPHKAVHSRSDQQASCPICTSPGHWCFDSRFVEVHRCENEQCNHLFAMGVDYDHGVMHAVDTDSKESMYAERNDRLVAFWEDRRFVTRDSTILDVGAGTGHLTRSVRKQLPGIDIHCVEESEALRDQLDRQGFTVSKNLDSISSDRSFTAVLLIEAIEHVANPVDFLDRLRRYLDPEGRIFLTTPCGELRNGSRATNAYDTPEHVQFFTEKSLRLAVKKAGFRGITYEYIDALYPRSTSALSFATFKRFATKIARPILAAFQGPRHLTGFIDP